ncbi:hypothetical protein [Mycobacterium riyadhense]|uniref:Membrane protein ArfC n=1 Tax=Mycobacterium riyadhense TaxID=486698 RepID=A0A1X2DEP5_9MYCO|nr:hypothetical protein [Mycobacterium riyadhense]MCV7146900.1 hypothetical protein [Mycobacterium riyadhense]ORW86444.1 hypothetical protein AWC22_10820 [Mycobacterium riyadhense]VTO98414.1 putative membrane protein ArfC [Mycobacterium riyadhense]
MGQVHWWLVALSFVLGMLLTFTQLVRPVNLRVPVLATPRVAATPGRAAPVKKPDAAKKPKRPGAHPKKKAGAKRPPRKRIPAAKGAPTARIPVAKDVPTERIPVAKRASVSGARFAPYGPGSARAEADGSGPDGWLVKGRSDTRLYYTPDDPGYDPIVAQVWFEDEECAARAFFTPWRKSAQRK